MVPKNELSGWSDNPFRTREDLLTAVNSLFEPIKPFFSPGRARVNLGVGGATFLTAPAELEGFARPLWGLIPLAMGGCDFPDWELFTEGIKNGSDPDHKEFWGYCHNRDQRLVELAVFGYALAAVPEVLWDPLDKTTQENLANWMRHINNVEMYDNNFWFFRILVNLGLKRVGAEPNLEVLESDLAHVENLYQGEGWYSDGHSPQLDYYNPWAMHYYGLVYSILAGDVDPERAKHYKERAEKFSQQFIHWFTREGAALPFGRSLTYRFCQAAFWGALAFAGVEALPWGVMKGLVLRHLRWWARQPILNAGDHLSIGYGYPCLNMAEGYNSPMSPYWAFKIFLPLALPESHPFWTAEEQALPELPEVTVQETPGLIFCRDNEHDHLFVLSQRQYARGEVIPEFRHSVPKYCKFAYSTVFGFSVPADRIGLRQGAYDSALAISEDGVHYRVREKILDYRVEGQSAYSLWEAGACISIETWLIPCVPWHVRLHHIHNERPIQTAEGGFAISRHTYPDPFDLDGAKLNLVHPEGFSGMLDLPLGSQKIRQGEAVRAEPNTNVLFPRTLIPTLIGKHEPGSHWLACAVIGVPGTTNPDAYWSSTPMAAIRGNKIVISYKGEEIFSLNI